MKYLYRFDMLSRLREQSSDPVLRAKRATQVKGVFDHHQVLAELKTLEIGQGVFRFCFWRDWNSLIKNLHPIGEGESPWIIQRIEADHPTLKKFCRDDDEYLVGEAWIFWQVNRVEPRRENWSPDGIPHEDIEVLTPQGQWERLSTSTLVRDSSFDAWRCLALRGANGHTPVFTRSLTRQTNGGDNQTWVLLRQPNGPWTTIWNSSATIADAVWLLLSDLRAVGLHNVRWVISLECEDRVLTAEVFPSLLPPKVPFLKKLLGIRTGCLEECTVNISERFEHLDQCAQRQLYHDFGIDEVLLLNRKYTYSQDLLKTISEQMPKSENSST